MKKKKVFSFLLFSITIIILINNCKKDKNETNNQINPPITVTDVDNNIYNTVTIGSQIWMKENLIVTHYQYSGVISYAPGNDTWGLSTGVYCDYNNKLDSSLTYGRLYNLYAVQNNHKICPFGWHVPSDSEWNLLITNLGGPTVAGAKLKQIGIKHWASPNYNANNESGFTALPGGYRTNEGIYNKINYETYWWSSNGTAWGVDFNSDDVSTNNFSGNYGFSVRCIKD